MTIALDDSGAVAYGTSPIPAVNLDTAQLKERAIPMLKTAPTLRQRIRDRDFTIVGETVPRNDAAWG